MKLSFNSNLSHAVVPAAGFGTRLLPGSKTIPKEMFPIVNKPAIEYIADEILEAGLNTIVLVTSKNKESIVDHFDRNFELESILSIKNKSELLKSVQKFNNLNFINIRQKEALGLGHAVYSAKEALGNNPFVVVLPDMFIKNGAHYLKMMLDIYKETGKGVIALMEVPLEQVSSYGVVDGNYILNGERYLITDMIEKPSVDKAPSNLAIVGRYVLPASIIDMLGNTKPGMSGEIQLTDSLKQLAVNEGMIGVIINKDDEIHDIGHPVGFVKANLAYMYENPEYKDEIHEYITTLIRK